MIVNCPPNGPEIMTFDQRNYICWVVVEHGKTVTDELCTKEANKYNKKLFLRIKDGFYKKFCDEKGLQEINYVSRIESGRRVWSELNPSKSKIKIQMNLLTDMEVVPIRCISDLDRYGGKSSSNKTGSTTTDAQTDAYGYCFIRPLALEVASSEISRPKFFSRDSFRRSFKIFRKPKQKDQNILINRTKFSVPKEAYYEIASTQTLKVVRGSWAGKQRSIGIQVGKPNISKTKYGSAESLGISKLFGSRESLEHHTTTEMPSNQSDDPPCVAFGYPRVIRNSKT